MSRSLNTVSCIRVASFVSLVRFGSIYVSFCKHSVGGNILEFAGGAKESIIISCKLDVRLSVRRCICVEKKN